MVPHSPDVAPSPEWSRVIEQERDRAFAEKAAKKAQTKKSAEVPAERHTRPFHRSRACCADSTECQTGR